MEFTKGAKDLIEKNLREIMEQMTLGQKDRAEVEKELRSNFYESSEAKARERNSSVISEEDVYKAFNEQGTPREIAGEYMTSYAGGLKRAGFWYRTLAFIIDMIVAGVFILIVASPFLLFNLVFQSLDQKPWITAMIVLMNFAIGLIVFGTLLCYFVILEGRFGMTVGKYVLGLKALMTDGRSIGYKEALLRNIPKFISNFIIIDALIMVIFFNKEKQRAFDKVADTIVVHIGG